MKTISLLLTNIFFLLPFIISAQISGEIQAYVYDKITKNPIPGASVYTMSKGNIIGSSTDNNGKFILKPLDAGNYSVTIIYMGYDSIKYVSVSVYADNITRLNEIYLSEAANNLPPILISTVCPHEIINVNNQINSQSFKEFPSEPGNLNGILSAMSTDIQIDQKTNKVIVRGARPTSTSYVVDGMRMGDDPMLPSMAVGSIEVFTGGIPAQYGDVTGGVIVVKTKSFFDEYYKRLEKEELKAMSNPN